MLVELRRFAKGIVDDKITLLLDSSRGLVESQESAKTAAVILKLLCFVSFICALADSGSVTPHSAVSAPLYAR
jgi:hypothetical protein